MNKLYVVGIGPGSKENMTFKAVDAIKESDTIVAYTKYLAYVEDFTGGKEIIKTGMTGEKERCQLAIDEYKKGKTVAIISTGDSGLYGMAGLVYEIDPSINIEVVPGVSAAFSSASVVGAPLMHDTALISLSDLLTDWDLILKRVRNCADADMVIALYNPKSKKRVDHLKEALDIIREYRDAQAPIAMVKNALREGMDYRISTLDDVDYDFCDMNTTVIIGNSQSYIKNGKLITPRGYKL